MPEKDLTALLAGAELPPDSPAGMRPVAEVLAALRAGPAGDELAGEQAALSQFRQQVGVSVLPRRSRRRRPVMLIAALATTAAVTLAVIGLSLDAYSDGLPGPMQRIAHDAIGAPAAGTEQSTSASPIPVPSGTPAGRRAGPPPGHGGATGTLSQLCASYQSTHGHGGGLGRSTAFHELITAAGGAGKIPAFCARVLHPGPPPGAPSPHAPPPPHPPHTKRPHPNANGNGNSQGGGGGNSQGNGHGQPTGGDGQLPGGGNGNGGGNSQGNGNGNAQGHGVADASWARALAP